jgi:putative peptidoglycan lipid II flippase
MVKLFRHTLNIFSRKQTSVFSAASVIITAVAISRVLGLFRDWLLVSRFTPEKLDPYFAAFRIPNFIFELLVMGALSTAFIPVFTTFIETGRQKEAFKIASSVINIGLIIFTIFSMIILVFTKEITYIIAPGFGSSDRELMISFTRILVVAQVFPLIIGNFLTGILQSYRNFLIPALAPVVYNLGIILGILLFSPILGLYGPVLGCVFGAMMFALIQIPQAFSFGFRHTLDFDIHHPGTREVGKLMLPRTLGLAVSQIDTTIDLILSSLLGPANVTIFYFAQHLQQVPVGLFGSSIAQASLPVFSSLFAQKKTAEFKQLFLASFHQILFFIIPLSAMFIVLRIPIVRLILGIRSQLSFPATLEISQTLAFFSISLFAQALVPLIAFGFYALHDTKTPVIIGTFSVVVNTILSIVFVLYHHLGVWALGLSTSIASIVQMTLLFLLLDRKVSFFNRYELLMPIFKMLISGIAAGGAIYIPIKLLDQLVFDTKITINLMMLTAISAILGLSVYLFLAWFLEIPQISVIYKILSRAKALRKGVMIDTTQEMVSVQETKI